MSEQGLKVPDYRYNQLRQELVQAVGPAAVSFTNSSEVETEALGGTYHAQPLPVKIGDTVLNLYDAHDFTDEALEGVEILHVSPKEFASAYLDRMLVNTDNEEIPDEAASLRDLKATPEERLRVRDAIIDVWAEPAVERMILPLMKQGDLETIEHELRLGAELAIAQYKRDNPERGKRLIRAAAGHDGGKYPVQALVRKPGALTNREREGIKTHVPASIYLARKAGITDKQVLTDINMHHGFYAEEGASYIGSKDYIPDDPEDVEEAAMLAVFDEYDALRGKRRYKPAMSAEEARTRLKKQLAIPAGAWDAFEETVEIPQAA